MSSKSTKKKIRSKASTSVRRSLSTQDVKEIKGSIIKAKAVTKELDRIRKVKQESLLQPMTL